MAAPPQVTPELISLRRKETAIGWGFKMHGGRDVQLPLFVCQVTPNSIAAKAGLGPGDAIVAICQANVMHHTHQEAKMECVRAGCELDLWVVRGVVNPKDPDVKAACGVGGGGNRRGHVVEDSIDPHMNEGSKYRDVMPKSYRMLEAQLGGPGDQGGPAPGGRGHEAQKAAAPAAPSGPAPGSIFNRQRDERSDYLKAQGETIQRAYGQAGHESGVSDL